MIRTSERFSQPKPNMGELLSSLGQIWNNAPIGDTSRRTMTSSSIAARFIIQAWLLG